MGLLDDAIREHLDLKRRRGADPTEVERAEREALGPVRRGPEPESAEGPDGVPAYDMEAEQHWQEPYEDEAGAPAAPPEFDQHYEPPASFERAALPLADESPLADEAPLRHEPPLSDEPPQRHEPAPADSARSTDFSAEDPFADDPFADDDHPGTPPPHPAPASPAPEPTGGETVEYRIDEALEAEPRPNADDPLEETPEFLQDTPDHDRLWFEQRPPKDFDFEG
ncbi:MAG: hypothetical protein QOD66_3170 [Solirubrobacteraceae bacterium]|jgi:hypothetical protein|nr:hypothetical protein [Solirubrobacteraceae bacterium]